MKRILVWGMGKCGTEFLSISSSVPYIEIVGITDSSFKPSKKTFGDYNVIEPASIGGINYDYIVVAVYSESVFQEIRNTIIMILDDDTKILKWDGFLSEERRSILRRKYSDSDDEEIKETLRFLENHSLTVRNNYSNTNRVKYRLNFDKKVGLPYVLYYGKRMYYPLRYANYEFIENVEENDQYAGSPHLYIPNQRHCVRNGDIVIDGGVCEGNFALKFIDQLKKVYLIEPDEEWFDVLRVTFEPWEDKVKLVKKYLCDEDGADQITIDRLVEGEPVDFVKMDIEGSECLALLGGLDTIEKYHPQLSICTYHKQNDARNIGFIMRALGYTTSMSNGYMFFKCDKNIDYSMDFRRGVIYGDFVDE